MALSLLLSCAAVPVYAQAGDPAPLSRNDDDVPNTIENADENPESRLGSVAPKAVEGWDAFKLRLKDKYGFGFSLAYAYALQSAEQDGEWRTGSGGQVEFDFTWTVLGREGDGPKGIFGGKIENQHRVFSDTPPQNVAPLAGSIWSGAPGYGDYGAIAVSQLWYEHHFKRDKVIARIGKITPFAIFDYYKFKSPRVGFLGQVQNVTPTIAYPPSALGLAAHARLDNGMFVTAGVFDANGTNLKSGFKTLFDEGELFTIAEIGWTPDFDVLLEPGEDYRPGNDDYHLTVWRVDARKAAMRPDGWGFMLSAQKGFDNLVPFLRYGYSNGGATPLKHLGSAGLGIENVFGFEKDLIALSFGWGKPSNSELRDQYALEVFYRMQLTENFQLTPDVQFIFNPALDPTLDTLPVLSLRGRLAF